MAGPAYVAYTPLDVAKPVAENIWVVDGPEIRMAYCGLHLPFPTRMTVVRLDDGGLWLHSPTEPSEALFANLLALGPVRFLVAPNTLHYWWLPEWKARFPEAAVYAAPGLRRSAKREMPLHLDLNELAPPVWADTFDQCLVMGGPFNEVDFYHRPSRTLILTDLIENFEPKRVRSKALRLLMRAFGAADPDGKAPFDLQLGFWRRRKPLRAAVERMILWDPERIIIAHGRPYDRNGTTELRRAFRWVL